MTKTTKTNGGRTDEIRFISLRKVNVSEYDFCTVGLCYSTQNCSNQHILILISSHLLSF